MNRNNPGQCTACYSRLSLNMTPRQRESAAKFLYDLAKGVALLTVVSPWVRGQESWLVLIFGAVGTLSIFLWAYRLEGGLEENKNDNV